MMGGAEKGVGAKAVSPMALPPAFRLSSPRRAGIAPNRAWMPARDYAAHVGGVGKVTAQRLRTEEVMPAIFSKHSPGK
jgi:hypothetical protein